MSLTIWRTFLMFIPVLGLLLAYGRYRVEKRNHLATDDFTGGCLTIFLRTILYSINILNAGVLFFVVFTSRAYYRSGAGSQIIIFIWILFVGYSVCKGLCLLWKSHDTRCNSNSQLKNQDTPNFALIIIFILLSIGFFGVLFFTMLGVVLP